MKRGKPAARRAQTHRKPGRPASTRASGARRGAPAPARSRTRTRPPASGTRARGASRRAASRPGSPAPARAVHARRPLAASRGGERETVRELENRLQILTAELEESRRARVAAETAAATATAAAAATAAATRAERAAIPPAPEALDEPSESEFVAVAEEPEIDYEDYDDEKDFLSPGSSLHQRRQDLDRERADRELELGDETYWLVCPKCGEHLVEHEFDNVKVERCEGCSGLWADKGELDLLLFASEDDRALAYRTRGLMQ